MTKFEYILEMLDQHRLVGADITIEIISNFMKLSFNCEGTILSCPINTKEQRKSAVESIKKSLDAKRKSAEYLIKSIGEIKQKLEAKHEGVCGFFE